MSKIKFAFATILGLIFSAIAMAGPVREFETSFRDAYADYRSALFTTNSGDAAATAKAMASFEGKWAALVARWGTTPPPQYADDPSWPEVLKKSSSIIAEAGTAVKGGKLSAAHEILEHFRDEIGALHARNNVATISDRMNAYHEKMEKVLSDGYGGFDGPGRNRLTGDVAVLVYLADELERHRPAELANSTEFQGLMNALRGSLAGMHKALAANDAEAIKKAINGLKPAYSKFFLRFG